MLQENNDSVISSGTPNFNSQTSVSFNDENVIGSSGRGLTNDVKTDKELKSENEEKETVAIHSTKNVSWPGVGKVLKGYNIVTKANSKKWLERSHTRIATPQEVAKEFGK
jgi:hypothetical protein